MPQAQHRLEAFPQSLQRQASPAWLQDKTSSASRSYPCPSPLFNRKSERARQAHSPAKTHRLLLKQFQYSGWQLVGLSQNRGGSLLQSLLLGQLCSFSSEVGILYATQCSTGVFIDVLQVGDGAGQTVLCSTEVSTAGVDGLQSIVDRANSCREVGFGNGAVRTGNGDARGDTQAVGVKLGGQVQSDLVGSASVGWCWRNRRAGFYRSGWSNRRYGSARQPFG
jgi:hypothetical protein